MFGCDEAGHLTHRSTRIDRQRPVKLHNCGARDRKLGAIAGSASAASKPARVIDSSPHVISTRSGSAPARLVNRRAYETRSATAQQLPALRQGEREAPRRLQSHVAEGRS